MRRQEDRKSDRWISWVGIFFSAIALIVSILAFIFGNRDSYLSHRAYATVSSWNISDLPDGQYQLQFVLLNTGETPAENVKVFGRLLMDGVELRRNGLTEGNSVTMFSHIPDQSLPKTLWILQSSDLNKLSSSLNNKVILNIEYQDFEGHSRSTTMTLVLLKISDKYRLQILSQSLN